MLFTSLQIVFGLLGVNCRGFQISCWGLDDLLVSGVLMFFLDNSIFLLSWGNVWSHIFLILFAWTLLFSGLDFVFLKVKFLSFFQLWDILHLNLFLHYLLLILHSPIFLWLILKKILLHASLSLSHGSIVLQVNSILGLLGVIFRNNIGLGSVVVNVRLLHWNLLGWGISLEVKLFLFLNGGFLFLDFLDEIFLEFLGLFVVLAYYEHVLEGLVLLRELN